LNSKEKDHEKQFLDDDSHCSRTNGRLHRQEPDRSEKINDKTLPVTRLITKDTALVHQYVADIQALRNVEIRARVAGFLEKIYVDEGQKVRKGQLLFRINAEEYQARLAKAKATLESAQAQSKTAELEVYQVGMLVAKKVISKTELDVAKAKRKAALAKIEEARSALANASIRLSYTNIRAPFNGIMNRIPLKAGSLIEEGALLTTVSDIRSVYAYFNVSEGEYLEYLKARQRHPQQNNAVVQLQLADGTGYSHAGKIETVEGEFDAGTGSIAFRARFPNPDKLLKHGATGTVRLANRIEDALIVPQKAVFEIQDRNYVFIVDSTNTIRMQHFVPQARFSHFYVVKSGLNTGDVIVYEGIRNIQDGLHIVPEMVPMDSLLAIAP
jgi:membrane fusion protein (multidrug efflux system)